MNEQTDIEGKNHKKILFISLAEYGQHIFDFSPFLIIKEFSYKRIPIHGIEKLETY
jgi:hypothetical protein